MGSSLLPRLSWTVALLLALAGGVCAQDIPWSDDFGDVTGWQQKESRRKEEIVKEGIRVEIKTHRDGSRPGPFLRITDRSSADHWFWLHKRKEKGYWDFSRAARVTLWARGSGARTTIRFLVGDDRGNMAYYALGPLNSKDWAQKSLDFRYVPPLSSTGAVNWCRVVLIGLRTDAGHGYTNDFGDLRIEAGEERTITGEDAQRLLRARVLQEHAIGFLTPAPSTELGDSMVGVNLMGNEDEQEMDLLARAGVKWAKVGCFLSSGYSPRMELAVQALLARGIRVVGHLPQALAWSPDLFPEVKGAGGKAVPIAYGAKAMEWYEERVRATAEHFKGRVCVWEIGNEPDTAEFWKPSPDPAAFARFVMEVSRVLKTVDPKNQVISGGVCGFWPPGFSVARDFLTTFLKAGAGASVDFLGLHPFRATPELGAPDMTQREVADEVRRMLAQSGCGLPLWDTEWQSTGVVHRREVPFATDLYEAKSMLRKYLVEADAGFAHMNWQIAKARPRMDHPGQIFTADGRPTAKYVTLCHTGALFSRLSTPVRRPVRLMAGGEAVSVSLLSGGGVRSLSGGPAAHIDTTDRWRPVQGAGVLEVRGVLKGDGCEVAIYPTPRDAQGDELPLPSRPQRPLAAQADYTPICLRCSVEPDWDDFGLRIELPKGGQASVDDLNLLYHLPQPQLASFAFTVGRAPSPAVFFWMPARPSDRQQTRTVDLAIQGMPDADYVVLDTLTGECRRLPRPQLQQGEAVFAGVPLCDYPMAIAPQEAFPLSSAPAWVSLFANAAQITDRSFMDRAGDFYLRGAWGVLSDLAERLDPSPASKESRDKLEAIKRARRFWRAFSVVPKEVAIAASAPVSMALRPAPGTWRESVANPGSRNVNRYYYELDDADGEAAVRGVRMRDRVLPQRPWADSRENAFTWFTLRRPEEATEVFVVTPEESVFDGRDCAIDLSLRPRATALLLSSRGAEGQCLAYWTKAIASPDKVSYMVELEDRVGWADGAVLVDPRKGRACGEALVRKREEGGRVLVTAPPAPQPLLLVPRHFARQVENSLSGTDPSSGNPATQEK